VSHIRRCVVCGNDFCSKRSDKLTCKPACRKAKSRRALDPDIGSEERKQFQLAGLQRQHDGILRKTIIRDLARHGLLPEEQKNRSSDVEQDPIVYASARWGMKRPRPVRGSQPPPCSKGPWEDRTVVGKPGPRPLTSEELWSTAFRLLLLGYGRSMYDRGWSAFDLALIGESLQARLLSHAPPPLALAMAWDTLVLDAHAPIMRRAYERRAQKPRQWLKVAIEVVRATKAITEEVRIRMLDHAIEAEVQKLDAASQAFDSSFRNSQKDWLEIQARIATLSRLMHERNPADTRLTALAERYPLSVTQQ
jgi:hypothetical protein